MGTNFAPFVADFRFCFIMRTTSCCLLSDKNQSDVIEKLKVGNVAKIRNRYNQVPHLTQDTT